MESIGRRFAQRFARQFEPRVRVGCVVERDAEPHRRFEAGPMEDQPTRQRLREAVGSKWQRLRDPAYLRDDIGRVAERGLSRRPWDATQRCREPHCGAHAAHLDGGAEQRERCGDSQSSHPLRRSVYEAQAGELFEERVDIGGDLLGRSLVFGGQNFGNAITRVLTVEERPDAGADLIEREVLLALEIEEHHLVADRARDHISRAEI
jgi:hypothetical protein